MRSDAYLKTFHAFREWVETHARFSVEATKCIGSILYRKVFPPRKIDNTEFTERKIDNTDFTERHRRQLKLFEADHDRDQAMRTTIGGEEFEAIGLLERAILIQYGLKKNAYVIDVGCGSGRLALPLSKYLSGKYLGIDVVPDLVEYARTLVPGLNWRFEVVKGLTIPEADGVADMVCFFSVFTHLLHEQSYLYLQEAKRVLKPTGKIVFSFLDFASPGHWSNFEDSVRIVDLGLPLNVFISKDTITAWATHLNLEVESIQDGDKAHIPLSEPVKFERGLIMEHFGTIGQSVCVLSLRQS